MPRWQVQVVTGLGGPQEGCLSDWECDAGRCSLEIVKADLSGKEDKEALARKGYLSREFPV